MRMKKLLALLLCVMMMLSCFSMFTATAATQIKNIIYMIPDGGGMVPFNLADAVKQAGGVNSKFPNSTPQTVDKMYLADHLVGAETTYSNNQAVTDSAAGGTALATGKKTNNYYIGISPARKPIATILEAAQYVGKRAGLVSTYPWAHATPAAFSSHAEDRYYYRTISQQMINQGLDLVLPMNATGGGAYDEAATDIASRGYSSVTSVDQMLALESGAKVWGTLGGDFAYSNRDIYNAASYPNLAEMTTAAIQALEGSDEGFFLMVEGSAVDGGGHASNGLDMVTEFIAFDEACKVAIEYAKGRTDTVVVAAADHDTGGMNVLNQATAISNIQNGVIPGTSVMTWDGNGSHTARNCGVFMYVPDGVDRIPGVAPTSGLSSNFNNYVINNTDIAPWLAGLIGVDLDETTSKLFVDVSSLGTYTPVSDTYYDYDDETTVTSSDHTGTFKFKDYDLTVERNTSKATYNGQTIDLDGQVCVYSGGRFYVPQLLLDTVGIEFDPSTVVTASSILVGADLVNSVYGNSGCSIGSDTVTILLANRATAYVTFEIGVPKTAYYNVQAMIDTSNREAYGNSLYGSGLAGEFDNGESITFAAGKLSDPDYWTDDSSDSVLLEAGNHTITFTSGDTANNVIFKGLQIVEDLSKDVDGSETPVATPTPTEAPDYDNITAANAPYAGVYQVTSDKAVTLTNETGHTVTLAAGVADYFYMIKGNNNITMSDTSATLTFTAIENNGMAYISEVDPGTTPVTSVHYNMGTDSDNVVSYVSSSYGNTSVGASSITIPNSSSVTLKTPSLPAGLYYMSVLTSNAGTYVTLETDTGHTGQYATTLAGNVTHYENAASESDFLLAYLREGENYITIKNNGASSITLTGVRCSRSSTFMANGGSATDATIAEFTLANCKVIADGYGKESEATPAPTTTPTAAPTATPTVIGDIDYTDAPYAGVYTITSDKAVTVTNHTGHTVTLSAGGSGYFYLVKGNNLLTITDSSASITFGALSGNGMDYISKVDPGTVPVTNEHIVMGDASSQSTNIVSYYYSGDSGVTTSASAYTISIPAGQSATLRTPSETEGGLYYMSIQRMSGSGVIRLETSTGHYGTYTSLTNGSYVHYESGYDFLHVYLRPGTDNYIKIINQGTSTATIGGIRAGRSSSFISGDYASDANIADFVLANCKVIVDESLVVPSASPTPTPTLAPNVVLYDVENAGVYQVTSDIAVTATSEIGSTVTLAAGETAYMYMIAGSNQVTLSDTSANLTFTALDGNGMDYFDQVSIPTEPIISGQEDAVSTNLYKALAVGESYTFTYNANKASLVYPYILFNENTADSVIRVSTDTGFYADLVPSGYTGTTWCWGDADRTDIEILYVRQGENTITIENIGADAVSIEDINIHSAGELSDHATWGSQLNVANLKVIGEEAEPTPTPDPTATPEPTEAPTPTPVPENVVVYNAPFAGIYAVTADADVTLTSELASVATIAAGETKYLYLIKGANNIETTNTAANVTITALAGQGMDYADQLVMGTEPVISGQEDKVQENVGYSLAPGATYTFTYTPSQGMAGLVYPYIHMQGAGETTLRVTSDTGFYADLFRPAWSGSSICWADADRNDVELLYVRNGENTITIENTGDETVTLATLQIHSAGELSDHATWGSQINVANLKPILSESEYTGFALDEAAATATVSFTQMGTIADEVVSLIIAEYDATSGKLLQVNIEYIDISEQAIGTTVEYSTSLTGVTGNLKAMLMNENLVPYFTVAD